MIASPEAGEFVTSACPRCKSIVRAKLMRRSVELARTRLVVPHVLVDVCPRCDHMISVQPESVEQLREAGSWK